VWQLLSCCSVCTCQHSYHSASRHFETTSLLIIFSTLPLLIYGVKHNSSAVISQPLKINSTARCHVVRHYCCADANTLQCVIQVLSSCFQLLNQSSNSTHIYTCMYFLQMFVNVKLVSHLQQPRIQSPFVVLITDETPLFTNLALLSVRLTVTELN